MEGLLPIRSGLNYLHPVRPMALWGTLGDGFSFRLNLWTITVLYYDVHAFPSLDIHASGVIAGLLL